MLIIFKVVLKFFFKGSNEGRDEVSDQSECIVISISSLFEVSMADFLYKMYSRNLLFRFFRDIFLLNNDVFAVRTRRVRRENRGN